MKKNIIIVSKMNCSLLTKQIANDRKMNFCDLYEKLTNDIGKIDDYKRNFGEDNFLLKERLNLKEILNYENFISFVSYDIFKHNIDMNLYQNSYIIMLDFGYFVRIGNEIVRMNQSVRYQKAKSICDRIIDCRNMSEDKILDIVEKELNG